MLKTLMPIMLSHGQDLTVSKNQCSHRFQEWEEAPAALWESQWDKERFPEFMKMGRYSEIDLNCR